MPVLEFVEHQFHRVIVMRKGFAHAVRQTRIIDQLAQAFACELEMS